MRVKLVDGKVLTVIFKKSPRIIFRTRRLMIDTFCFIYDGPDRIGQALAKQNPLDTYDKITGKKISLTRALQCDDCIELDKGMRTTIWNAFRATFGFKRKGPKVIFVERVHENPTV